MTLVILADTREKKPWACAFADEVKHITLATGDYTLEGFEEVLAIERKRSVAELATNVTEDRFKNWTARLSEFPRPYIICEFSLEDVYAYPKGSSIPRHRWRYIRVRGKYIMKRVFELQEMGIEVIFAGSREAAEVKVKEICVTISNGQ